MNTLFDKIWDKHVVQIVEDGPTQLYIDRLYCHEVTSPQAFAGMRARGLKMFRPDQIFCMPDHNTPTHDQDKPIEDPISKKQVDTLAKNTADFGVTHFAMNTKDNGIIHVVGPEKGLSLPGMTIVCGDSHTSTHGAMGAVAFGIGTSEVEMVMASQCILQSKPKSMRISINGKLSKGVTAKDVALYLMSQLTTSGATGYFVEYSGDVVKGMSMEGRLTLCNLSIEMGARGGFVAPDETTFEYIKGREYAPKGEEWDKAVAYWKTLKSGDDAVFDKELTFEAMLHISAGTAVKSIWSFSFALIICHEVTGSERAIQRLLPSRDIAGAVSIFIEESRHKSKHANVGAYSSKSSSIRVTTPINQSLFISEKTATAIINSAPSEQLSI